MIGRPEIHPKGWGEEQWIVNTPLYCGKRFIVRAGKRCSLHYHKLKDETFFVEGGALVFELNGKEFPLSVGDSLHIKPGDTHRFEALVDTVVFEFSTQHFEDDSYRLEKGD